MQKLSVLIPTFNNEASIRSCLETVSWADEILICDSYSTDSTLEIARAYTNRIIQHEYINSAKQKNWAIPQCQYDWVFILDTDEVLEEGLKEEIRRCSERNGVSFDGYRIPRKNFVYGRWVKHAGLYPDYQVRLFRKEKGRYIEREVHAHVVLAGKVGTLEHHLLHNGFKDISTWLTKIERYTRYERDECLKQRKPLQALKHLFGAPLIFLDTFFLKLGFLEGHRGLLVSALNTFYYFLIGVRLWETAHTKDRSSS